MRRFLRHGVMPPEVAILLGSVLLITSVGALAHRWMWRQAELVRYRCATQELARIVSVLQQGTAPRHRTYELRVDAPRGRFQLVAVHQTPSGEIATVERTLWLPEGLQISEAPTVMSPLPTGKLPEASVTLTAPSFQRVFRVTSSHNGRVRCDEEPIL